MPAQLISADNWPDNRFIVQDRCCYCGGDRLERCVKEVRDWYLEAVPGSFEWLQCQECFSLLVEKRPNDQFILEAYRNYPTHSAYRKQKTGWRSFLHHSWRIIADGYARSRHGTRASFIDRFFAMLVDYQPARKLELSTYYRFLQPRPMAVLDFGCGNGDFLLRAKALGHQVFGVDFDEAAVKTAQKSGIPAAHTRDINPAALDSKFDLVTANHVLEHVADPRSLLCDFYHWLKPGGTLFLELPDAQARGLARHGNFWRGLETPRHFSLPSRKGILMALGRAKFLNAAFIDRKIPVEQMDQIALKARRKFADFPIFLPQNGVFESFEFITLTATKDPGL